MTRKRVVHAEAETQRAHEARLRYLGRNPEFRRAIDALIKQRNALPGSSGDVTPERIIGLGELVTELQRVAKEWNLSFGVVTALSWPEWHANRDHRDSIPAVSGRFDPPVIAWTTLPPPLGTDAPKPTPEEIRYLNLRVDLEYPADTLLPMIEKELGRYSREYRQGRQRLDRVDFHLQVFDLAESGETFKAISMKLNRRPSTVKSAFLVARRNIFRSAGAPSKNALPLASFDKDTHSSKCSVCRNADSFEAMCGQARRYALQDHTSQRELTGHDRVR